MKRSLIATALLAALATGCGAQQAGTGVASVTAGKTSGPSATPTGTTDPQEQGRKFAQCMRDNGVPMEDPDPDGGGGLGVLAQGGDKQKVREAVEACRAHAPFKDRASLDPDQVEQLRQFAQCMRDNGVDMPDPSPDGTFGEGAASGIKRDSPQFKKAFEVCGKKFPKMGATQ